MTFCAHCGSDRVTMTGKHGWIACRDCGTEDHGVTHMPEPPEMPEMPAMPEKAKRALLAPPGECIACDRIRERGEHMYPPHDAATGCKSGHYAHCTCDTCF